MPIPHRCPHPECRNHRSPPQRWFVRYGSYCAVAHGRVQRYRCRRCLRTFSDQSESLQYFAKRRLPLRAVWQSLLGGASQREVARRYRLSPQALQAAVLRLGRQAMGAHSLLLSRVRPRGCVVYDGLRSYVSSQDYPCDITTVVEVEGEMILSMTHTVSRRGGSMKPMQRERVRRKLKVWRPQGGSMSQAIALVQRELWEYLRPAPGHAARILTDEHPLYRALLLRDPVARHLRSACQLIHERTPAAAPRTVSNPLFAVNYIDRLLRHRLKEHTRESIAFGREATLQMHRAWIFAYDHNCLREYRVKAPKLGTHAAQGAIAPEDVQAVNREFFTRRIHLAGVPVPETIRRVWMGELPTPPLRWKVGQRASSVHIPAYAVRDLLENQHAA
jgi:transposase-like protein